MALPPAPPSPFPRSVIGVAVVAGALGIGFCIGRVSSTRTENPAEAAIAPTVSANAASGSGGVDSASPSRRSAEETRVGTREHTSRGGDPIARLQAAKKTGGELGRILRVIGILSQLSVDEIPIVLAFATSGEGVRGKRDEGEIFLYGAIVRWAQIDPSAAADWTRANANDLRGKDDQMLETALTEWTAREPAAARAWIDQLTDRGQKTAALRGYFAALAARDPAAALLELRSLPEDVHDDQHYVKVFSAWASADPRAAMAGIATLTGTSEETRKRALESVVEEWGQQAPREALAWAMQNPNVEDQSGFARSVLAEWIEREPEAAMAQLLSLPAHLRDAVAPEVVGNVARTNPENARRLAELLPEGTGRERALGMVAVYWAGRDPAAAADFARSFSGEAAAESWPRIARSWVQRGAAPAAAEWVAQLPEGQARSEAAGNVIDSWGQRDPVAVANWLEQLPSGPTRDTAASAFAAQVRETDPAGAMAWAETVGSVNQRENAVSQVLETWRKKDPAAAGEWLRKTKVIGADLRSVLLRAPGQ